MKKKKKCYTLGVTGTESYGRREELYHRAVRKQFGYTTKTTKPTPLKTQNGSRFLLAIGYQDLPKNPSIRKTLALWDNFYLIFLESKQRIKLSSHNHFSKVWDQRYIGFLCLYSYMIAHWFECFRGDFELEKHFDQSVYTLSSSRIFCLDDVYWTESHG